MSSFTFTYTGRSNSNHSSQMKKLQEEKWKAEKENFISQNKSIMIKILMNCAFEREISKNRTPSYLIDFKKKCYLSTLMDIEDTEKIDEWQNFISCLNFFSEDAPVFSTRRPLFLKDLIARFDRGEDIEQIYKDYRSFLLKHDFNITEYRFADYVKQFPIDHKNCEFICDSRRIAYGIKLKKLSEMNVKFLE